MHSDKDNVWMDSKLSLVVIAGITFLNCCENLWFRPTFSGFHFVFLPHDIWADSPQFNDLSLNKSIAVSLERFCQNVIAVLKTVCMGTEPIVCTSLSICLPS